MTSETGGAGTSLSAHALRDVWVRNELINWASCYRTSDRRVELSHVGRLTTGGWPSDRRPHSGTR